MLRLSRYIAQSEQHAMPSLLKYIRFTDSNIICQTRGSKTGKKPCDYHVMYGFLDLVIDSIGNLS